ncbi:MAG: YggS family pyridoxal phosphate-dependent enzyme, partial [Nitrospirae bacterium]|nr:YggS family pyridoxal phosphate-dependent enzyme [Nitrospirota bacterium]
MPLFVKQYPRLFSRSSISCFDIIKYNTLVNINVNPVRKFGRGLFSNGVNMTGTQIFENIRIICGRISHAAIRAGRKPEDIKLIAVTKTISIQQIKEAIDAGLRIFGESKVQEAREKIQDSRCKIQDADLEWHLIGHLQKNKAKTAVELFEMIHSVDSFELAEIIDKHAENAGKIQRILLQVKLSDEISKYGILKDNLFELVREISEMKNLRIEGLMTIPPFF